MELEIVDLRTKQNVIDYMENYDVEVPIIEKEDDYEEDDYVPCSETGLSNKEIVDILFDSKEPKYIRHSWYTDLGDTRTRYTQVGALSYFKYEKSYREPDYPYIVEITKEHFYEALLTKKNELKRMKKKIKDMLKYFEE